MNQPVLFSHPDSTTPGLSVPDSAQAASCISGGSPQRMARWGSVPTKPLGYPKAAVYKRLTNEALGIMLRVLVSEEIGQAISLEELANSGGSTMQAVGVAFAQLCSLGILTDELLRDAPPAILPPPQPKADRLNADQVAYEAGEWAGSWSTLTSETPGDIPALDVSVVYFMYDDVDRLAYVGSTIRFRERMKEHAETRRSVAWCRWSARECRDRQDAYVLESREIAALVPYQNGTRGAPRRGARRESIYSAPIWNSDGSRARHLPPSRCTLACRNKSCNH